MVGRRNKAILTRIILNKNFHGNLMSDGWIVYREYKNRLRCWAHLMRKAQGLSESCDLEVSEIGLSMLEMLTTFQNAIYDARNNTEIDAISPVEIYKKEIEDLHYLCEKHKDKENKKLRSFSRELLNDWDIIFRPMSDPSLPLTNNCAEQILRHWVIDRRLSYGTRTEEGTKSFTILASVIETCRARGASTWDFLTQVISKARKGLEIPYLPAIPI